MQKTLTITLAALWSISSLAADDYKVATVVNADALADVVGAAPADRVSDQ